ncbi:MAG: 3-dehydroquinate synthase [Clostridia bacterium]|nr:3-dehydroquinate synthase [Clostridia bacterium]
MVINVNLGAQSYCVNVERDTLNKADKFLNLNRKVLIVTDDGVPSQYSNTILKLSKEGFVVCLPQGENSKSFKCLEKLLKTMLDNNFTRQDCVVAVGGGVVGDLAGFAAAVYQRGIDFYNIPTTLLSQVDSSIGGKVAVNFEGIKNIIGAFYQPKFVLIDPNVLKTLPKRQITNGMAESIKMALTSDKDLFEIFENNDPFLCLDEIIIRSLNIKKRVVEQDEKEQNLRKILNFGHTVGHAIESVKFGELYHGECVALGMLKMCSDSVKSRLINVLNKVGLPLTVNFDAEKAKAALLHDKKSGNKTVSVIKVYNVGQYSIEEIPNNEIQNLI